VPSPLLTTGPAPAPPAPPEGDAAPAPLPEVFPMGPELSLVPSPGAPLDALSFVGSHPEIVHAAPPKTSTPKNLVASTAHLPSRPRLDAPAAQENRYIRYTIVRRLFIIFGAGRARRLSSYLLSMDPGVELRLVRATYAITGSTAEHLRAMIGGRGARRAEGRFPGYTDWLIDWTCEPRRADDVTRPGRVAVLVSATMTLPAWTPPAWAAPELVASWRAYLEALELHERGHVDIAVAAGRRMLDGLQALPGFASADLLQEGARGVAERAIRAARRAELEYDAETRHGRTQGAVL
jgi:predicted secreted Zn-dependent protease